ncbi:MAG: hypothetical protein SH848_10840 [Saprospiraceae bacterium]|nr:hypothetical protein [Saprospiraceae bacterium]MDZ4704418.1 hypothetical protein [Saprospiraceae bacterium]
MVETNLTHKVLKELEKFLIRANAYLLAGESYDLILLVPSDKYLSDAKYSLIISARKLNALRQRDVIKEMLSAFKEALEFDEYNSISRINIVHTDDPFVKNLKHLIATSQEEIMELVDVNVGGVTIDFAYLVKSMVLERLAFNRAVTLDVIDDNGLINRKLAGVIRIDKNFDVVHYTGKGLGEIWKPEMTAEEKAHAENIKKQTEDYLISNQFIEKTRFDDIIRVI